MIRWATAALITSTENHQILKVVARIIGAVGTVAVVAGCGLQASQAAEEPSPGPAASIPASFAPASQQPAYDCPVTIPPQPGFTPPNPYPATYPDEGSVWYGDEDLWTVLDDDGDRAFTKGEVLWSANFPGGFEEEAPDVHVTWRLLDSDLPLVIDNEGRASNAHTEETGWFMIAFLHYDFAEEVGPNDTGCWEVTATYKDATLSFIYERP